MTKTQILKIAVSAVAMIAVMIAIFLFSNQNGETSSEVSDSVGEVVLEILDKEVPENTSPSAVPIIFEFNIRNLAHIFLYMLLGLTSFLFSASVCTLKGEFSCRRLLLIVPLAVVISFLYACFDEFLHQAYIGGRSASMRDVGIDTIGYSLLILISSIIFILCVWRRNIKLKTN